MLQKEFDQKLLADILVYAINMGFMNVDKCKGLCIDDETESLTKQDIIQIANQVLSKETLEKYPEFKIKKPNLFSKLNDATPEAKNALETKRDMLHQLCINIMADFPELSSVSIENVEYGVIKIMRSNKTYDVTTHIVINDEKQLKHDIKEFLNKS